MANGDELAYEVIQGASNRWRAVRDGILGHMAEAAATGAVGTTKTQMAYIKQIVNLLNPSGTFDLDQIAQSLYGGSGISTFPTAAQAGTVLILRGSSGTSRKLSMMIFQSWKALDSQLCEL